MSRDFTADLAVVIGINDYAKSLGRLETPVRDANAVAEALKSRFGYDVTLLLDSAASKESLEGLLSELPDRMEEGSRLLFYFAGHGVAQDSDAIEGPRGFLVPHGATSAVESHLSMEKVHKALMALPCRHLLVVLDCCFSGSFHWEGRRPMYLPGELLYEERYRYWVLHPAHWALASAAHDQYSLDIADRRRGQEGSNSPFAAAFLAGLSGEADRFPEGGDGVITLAELYAYVQQRLAPHQSPVLGPLKGQTRGEFVFRNPREPLALQSAAVAVELEPGLNPYRGLKPYRVEDAPTFFGRGDATRLLREWVKAHPWTVVVGPSGSGKSSLVQAGLLPSLGNDSAESWTTPPPLRVAGDPFAALQDALPTVGGSSTASHNLKDPGQAKTWAASWVAAHPSARLLLVIDQAEELVTRVVRREAQKRPESLPEEAARFLSSLASLIQDGGGRIHVVISVRSDYETDLDDGPWSSLWKKGRFIVPALRREDLRQIIEGPAATRALYFDDSHLVDRLVDEVWGMPGGLPLLSYALSRLFLAYVDGARGDRLLTAQDIAAIGGESGGTNGGAVAPGGILRVLRKGADEAVANLPDDSHRETLWRILLRMVNLVGTRTTRRQVPLDELSYPEAAENRRVDTVRQRFIDEARLLVSDQNSDRILIEPAHDELLIAWPALAQRIEAARIHLPVHRRLTEAAAEWFAPANKAPDDRRRKRDLDLRLLGLVENSGLPKEWLNKAEADYIAAARRERRRRTALRWAAVVVILMATTGAALFFRYQGQRNERLRYQAIIQGLANQAEADLGEGETAEGLLLTRQAFVFLPQSRGALANPIDQLVRRALDIFFPSRDNDQENRIHGLFRRALDDLPPSRIVFRGSEDPRPLALQPGGRLFAAGLKGKLVLATLPAQGVVPESGFSPVSGGPPDERPTQIAFSTDGRLLAAGFDKGTLCVWRLTGTPPVPTRGDSLCTPAAGRGTVTSLAFRPRAPVFVVGRKSGNQAGIVQVWEVSDGPEGSLWLERSERVVPEAEISQIGGDAPTEETATRWLCSGSATELAVDPKGGRLAVSCDGVLRLWDLQPLPGGWIRGIGRIRLPLPGTPTALTVRPGSPHPLAVGFANGDVELYNSATGSRQKWKRPSTRQGRPGLAPEVAALFESPAAGYRVLGNDGLWWGTRGEASGVPRQLLGPVCAAAGSADGAWLAVLVSRPLDPAVLTLWPASGPVEPVPLPSQRREGYFCDPGLAFHPTRTELAVGQDTDVILWSLTAGGQWQPRRLAEAEGRIYAVAWNGDLLAVGGRGISLNGSITLLHGSTGKILHRWTITGLQATRLAFEPGGRRLVAGTSDGALRIWNLDVPEAPPIVLRRDGTKIDSFAFLDPDRLAALTGQELTIWNLGTERLADAACNALSENLGGDAWINYVDPDLSQYEPACPKLGPHSLLLSHADFLAETGNEAEARGVFRRLNKLQQGTVVHPFRRAYSNRLLGKLHGFKGSNRQDVLSAMAQAQEYERLRQREGLPELRKEIQLLLCRRGALLGEPARALPFCDNAVRLFRDPGMAHDSRGLARALVGDLSGAREDFLFSRDWQEDSTWQARRQEWIDALTDRKNPITPKILRRIAREERGMTVDNVARPGGRYYYTSLSSGAEEIGTGIAGGKRAAQTSERAT